MPSSVYSTRFLAINSAGDSFYEVPAAKVAVLRSVAVFNASYQPVGWSIRIGTPSVYLLGSVLEPLGSTQPASYAQSFDVRIVLHQLERLYVNAAAGAHVTCSGYLFSI